MTDVRVDAYDAAAAVDQTEVVHAVYIEQYPPGPALDAYRALMAVEPA